MSSLRPPGLGPIVGHTTDRTCRLWMQAPRAELDKRSSEEDRRTIGVLVVVAAAGAAIPVRARPVFYFRLRREFERTGTFNLGEERSLGERGEPWPLAPDTEYRVRLASLALDDNLDNDAHLASTELADLLPRPEVWAGVVDDLPAECEACFRTFPAADQVADALAFLIGSCRYPGLLWKVKESDQIFGPMLAAMTGEQGGVRPRFVVMAGDQIYADAFNKIIPIGLADTHEEFTDRYQRAFGSLNMRRLLRNATTYMILDDHEIEDNWCQGRIRKPSKKMLFNLAIGAYMSYQWSHGPRSFGRRLYYQFESGGYPFFTLDTRTQRYIDDVPDSLADNHMLGRPALDPAEPGQLEVLCAWLARQQQTRGNVPKFIVTSSVFVPNPVSAIGGASVAAIEDTDSWPAFPNTRRAILRTIVAHGVQNVVFLAGDVHCSHVAQMYFRGGHDCERLRAFSVVSSAFYWPFPFADGDPSEFVHDSQDARTPDTFQIDDGVTMDYRAWNFSQEDNFCRVTAVRDRHALVVEVLGRDGKPIAVRGPLRTPVDLTSHLDLAPW